MKKTLNFLKTNLHLVVTFLLYVVTVIFFARLNYLFGAVTSISISMIIIYPVLIFIVALLLPRVKESLKISDKASNLTCYITIGVLLAISAVFIVVDPYNFIAYTVPAAVIPIAIYVLLKNVVCKCVYKYLGAIVLATIIVVSFVFIAITSPTTIQDSTELLEKSGYTDIRYILVMEEDLYTAINEDYEDLPYSSYQSDMGMYIFNGKYNEKEFAIYVEVSTGKIIISQNFEKHEPVQFLNSYAFDAE